MLIEELYNSRFDASVYLQPYRSAEEYITERMQFLDLCFTVACIAKGLSGGDLPERESVGYCHGLSVSSSDLFSILTPDSDADDVLTPEAREQVENAFFHVECRTRQTLRGNLPLPFETVSAKFALDEFERFALLLAFAPAYDRKYEGVFTYLHNSSSDTQPTRWMALRLFRLLFGITPASAVRVFDGTSPLVRFLTIPTNTPAERNAATEKLMIRPRAAAYILGKASMDTALAGYAEPYSLPEEMIPVREDSFAAAQKFFLKNAFRKDGPCAVLNIFGSEGIGRRFLAAHAAASAKLPLLSVDLQRLTVLEERDIIRWLDTVYLECTLSGAIPCFLFPGKKPGAEEEEKKITHDTFETRMDYAAVYIARLFRFVFWITEERDQRFSVTDALTNSMELPMLTAEERKLFWNSWASPEEFSPEISLDICASQYILTPRNLKRVLHTARDTSRFRGTPITKDILKDAVRQHSRSQLGLYATLINAVFTWDDLVVSDDQKRKMKMICDQVRYRRVVGEEWGFRKKSPYGNGLCALFYGSPGTGKTMAVQVMANELGIDLYRIDLSQLVSKYIGETQKNISDLFNRAKNINAMLFFDEADSMFAKRSEVKDSNDRYANADTAFLLQKLEDYEGITILATNYVNNIDDAFKRRIKFMINFVFPTPDVRLMLWKKIAPPAARFDEEIDYDFFAENFELTGSNIKEIFTNAAYIAAAEGAGIRNCHIIEAIKLNFSKYGKILTDDDFGYLAR